MRRIVLVAVSHCIGLAAFCQSPANAPGPAQNPFNSSSSPQSMFTFGGGQPWQGAPFKIPSCNASKSNTKQEAARPGTSRIFQAPCMDPQIFALNAQNSLQAPALPGRKWPQAKSIPIPTEWPNAKFEPIPTEWPNLKMLPVKKPAASDPAK